MLKIEKRFLEIDAFGELIKISFPNRLQSKELRDNISKAEKAEDVLVGELLVSLGMPEHILNQLTDVDLLEILKELSGNQKKN
jgi:hypothetical protein